MRPRSFITPRHSESGASAMVQTQTSRTGNRFRELWDEISAADDLPAYRMERSKTLVSEFPGLSITWLTYGRVLRAVSRVIEAQTALERAVEVDDGRSSWRISLEMGDLFRQRGENVLAESWYRRAINVSPNETAGFIFLGALLAVQGRLTEAARIVARV
jgi:tetratricopeptide (TPR) repeat protein